MQTPFYQNLAWRQYRPIGVRSRIRITSCRSIALAIVRRLGQTVGVESHTAFSRCLNHQPRLRQFYHPPLSDPERWVDEHGDFLFKFALARLRDPLKAEDVVQETFLAVLKIGKSFPERATEKSWLVGILKNKIFDHYRKTGRETSFTDLKILSGRGGGAVRYPGPF